MVLSYTLLTLLQHKISRYKNKFNPLFANSSLNSEANYGDAYRLVSWFPRSARPEWKIGKMKKQKEEEIENLGNYTLK